MITTTNIYRELFACQGIGMIHTKFCKLFLHHACINKELHRRAVKLHTSTQYSALYELLPGDRPFPALKKFKHEIRMI
jgi:hypothetical protein